jgi:hypothetical protein
MGGIARRSGGRSHSQGEEEDSCRSERKEQTVAVSGIGVADWWLG